MLHLADAVGGMYPPLSKECVVLAGGKAVGDTEAVSYCLDRTIQTTDKKSRHYVNLPQSGRRPAWGRRHESLASRRRLHMVAVA